MESISITFTAEDIEKASHYLDNYNCLVATALKRMGYKEVGVAGYTASIGGMEYYPEKARDVSVSYLYDYDGFPNPERIGDTITLTSK